MSRSTTRHDRNACAEIEREILDAVQHGHTRLCELVSFRGPKLTVVNVSDTERELHTPQVMRATETLIRRGYPEREATCGLGQTKVSITDDGREAAPDIPDHERRLVLQFRVSPTALNVLEEVMAYEEEPDSAAVPATHRCRPGREQGIPPVQDRSDQQGAQGRRRFRSASLRGGFRRRSVSSIARLAPRRSVEPATPPIVLVHAETQWRSPAGRLDRTWGTRTNETRRTAGGPGHSESWSKSPSSLSCVSPRSSSSRMMYSS